jgi:hypothetical protein
MTKIFIVKLSPFLLLFSLLLLLQACGGHMLLKFKGCDDSTKWVFDPPPKKGQKSPVIIYDVNLTEVIYTGSKWSRYPDKFQFNEILKRNNLNCRDLKFITITTQATFIDNVIGLLPFITRKTLQIRAIKKLTFTGVDSTSSGSKILKNNEEVNQLELEDEDDDLELDSFE